MEVGRHAELEVERQVWRWAGRLAGRLDVIRQAGRQVWKWAGRQTCLEVGRQAGRWLCMHKAICIYHDPSGPVHPCNSQNP